MGLSTDYRKYRFWFSLFLTILLGGFAVGMLTYGDPFRFWLDPFSGLGATETPTGNDNHVSMVIFVGDMIITGILFVRITVLFARDRDVPFRGARIIFSICAAFGAFIATFPHNIFDIQHKLGSGFLVGGVWFLSIFFIIDAGAVASRKFQFALHALLHSTVLAYAISFFLNSDTKHTFQKFAIAGMAIAIEVSLNRLCREPAVAVEEATVYD